MKGTDHAFSLEPVGMRKLVRDLQRHARRARRRHRRSATRARAAADQKMGKKLVAARDLPRGTRARAEDDSR